MAFNIRDKIPEEQKHKIFKLPTKISIDEIKK